MDEQPREHLWEPAEWSDEGVFLPGGPIQGHFTIARQMPLWICTVCREATNMDPVPGLLTPCPGEPPDWGKDTRWQRLKHWLVTTRLGLTIHVLRDRPLIMHIDVRDGTVVMAPDRPTIVIDCHVYGRVPLKGVDPAFLVETVPAPASPS